MSVVETSAFQFENTLYASELAAYQAQMTSLEADLTTQMTALIDGAGTTASKVATLISDLKSGGTISTIALDLLSVQERIVALGGS